MITKIQKWGNSHGIRLPQYILTAIAAKDNQEVDISVKGDAVIIRPIKKIKKVTIQELFDSYTDEYMPTECETDIPQGKEVW